VRQCWGGCAVGEDWGVGGDKSLLFNTQLGRLRGFVDFVHEVCLFAGCPLFGARLGVSCGALALNAWPNSVEVKFRDGSVLRGCHGEVVRGGRFERSKTNGV